MSNPPATPGPENYAAFNYCIAFIDLLGQRDSAKGQGLLPILKTDAEEKEFQKVIRKSIGAIVRLQHDAERMLQGATNQNRESPLRAKLSEKDRLIWDQMQLTRLTTQRWSDGLVSFVSLGDQEVRCVMNGVFSIFGLAGSLCFLGLAQKRPLRGAIDVAWGVEIHPGELYGPVIARAYELESEIAQYPRIVIGPRTVGFLKAHLENTSDDHFSRLNRDLAKLCLDMLVQDSDGFACLHYLGPAFRWAVTMNQHQFLYEKAHEFVRERQNYYQTSRDSKLAFRYAHLLDYFDAHPPTSSTPIHPKPQQ